MQKVISGTCKRNAEAGKSKRNKKSILVGPVDQSSDTLYAAKPFSISSAESQFVIPDKKLVPICVISCYPSFYFRIELGSYDPWSMIIKYQKKKKVHY